MIERIKNLPSVYINFLEASLPYILLGIVIGLLMWLVITWIENQLR